jgi:putative oxidoreductase
MMTRPQVQAFFMDAMLLTQRIVFAGYMCAGHGYKKWMKWEIIQNDFATPFGMSPYLSAGLTIFAEFFCCLLIIVGLTTRWAAIPNVICMLVAAIVIHAGDPWSDKESALLFCCGFLSITVMGPGRWSLDYFLRNTKLGAWL